MQNRSEQIYFKIRRTIRQDAAIGDDNERKASTQTSELINFKEDFFSSH